MKILIGFLKEQRATAEAIGNGPILWSGSGAEGVKQIARFYEKRLGVSGQSLLETLLDRLSGYWWAVDISDTVSPTPDNAEKPAAPTTE